MNLFGQISGTPTTTGTSTVTLQVIDFGFPIHQTTELPVLFKIDPKPPSGGGVFTEFIVFERGRLPRGVITAEYQFQVKALGGTPPYTYSATGLPSNLSINSSTGLISGTLINAGRFDVVITIHDSKGATQTFYNTFAVDTALCVLCGLF